MAVGFLISPAFAAEEKCECEKYEYEKYEFATEMEMIQEENDYFTLKTKEGQEKTISPEEMEREFPKIFLFRKEIGKSAGVFVSFFINPKGEITKITGILLLSLEEERGGKNDWARVQKEGE